MISIELLERAHWSSVRKIYAEGIASRGATFETAVPEWEQWDRSHLPSCRFVADQDGAVVGWAALSPYSSRAAYAGVAEASVYVSGRHRRAGIGSILLGRLVSASEEAGIWTLQGSVFPENEASIVLCKNAGFREVGLRERIGELDGVWKDVLLLERRSPRVAVSGSGLGVS